MHDNKHHIIPSSRGGNSELENIALVGRKEHECYHKLYGNKTPEEIIEYTVRVFFNDNWKFVETAYNRYSHHYILNLQK